MPKIEVEGQVFTAVIDIIAEAGDRILVVHDCVIAVLPRNEKLPPKYGLPAKNGLDKSTRNRGPVRYVNPDAVFDPVATFELLQKKPMTVYEIGNHFFLPQLQRYKASSWVNYGLKNRTLKKVNPESRYPRYVADAVPVSDVKRSV